MLTLIKLCALSIAGLLCLIWQERRYHRRPVTDRQLVLDMTFKTRLDVQRERMDAWENMG